MRTRTMITTICAAALSVAAMPASASQGQGNTVAKEKQAQPQKDKKVCKWLPATGSNRVERHCLTPEEWKKAEAQSW